MTSSQQARTDVRFDDLGLADPIVEVLTSKGFAHPFPIQADACAWAGSIPSLAAISRRAFSTTV